MIAQPSPAHTTHDAGDEDRAAFVSQVIGKKVGIIWSQVIGGQVKGGPCWAVGRMHDT